MICKRIKFKSTNRGRRQGIAALAFDVKSLSTYVVDANPERRRRHGEVMSISRYLLDLHTDAKIALPGEKVATFGTRNLLSNSLGEQQSEMIATIATCPRAKRPIEHLVFSWQKDERPSAEQAEELVSHALERLGATKLQAMWSLHTNTTNHHVHLMVLKIDPATRRAVDLGDGWIVDRLHQVVAEIEERQGWKAEVDAIYQVVEGATVHRLSGDIVHTVGGRNHAPSKTPSPCLDNALAERVLIASRASKSWPEFHQRLAINKIEYAQVGSGARILNGDLSWKASAINRDLSISRMEKRLGAFEPNDQPIGRMKAPTFDPMADAYKRYRETCESVRRNLYSARKDAIEALVQSANGQPAATIISLKEAISAAFSTAETSIGTWPNSFEQWTNAGRPTVPQAIQMPVVVFPASSISPISKNRYLDQNLMFNSPKIEYHPTSGKLFSDFGTIIIVHASTNINAVEQALLTGARRWGAITVRGPAEFLELATTVARKHDISLMTRDGQILHHSLELERPIERPADIANASPAPTENPTKSDDEQERVPLTPQPEHTQPEPKAPTLDEQMLIELALMRRAKGFGR